MAMSSPKKRRLNEPKQPPPLVNPLKNRLPFFQRKVIPRFEDEFLQNYVKVLKGDPKIKEESMGSRYEYVVDNSKERKNNVVTTKLVSDHPYLRFFNDTIGKFKLVNDDFLEKHRFNLKTKAYVPYVSGMLNVAKVAIARGAFKTVVLVDNTIACSIEVGVKEFIQRRKYVLGYLDKVLDTAKKSENGESALRKVLQVPLSSRSDFFQVENKKYYACTMTSNLCRSMDLFAYQSGRKAEIKQSQQNNIESEYFNYYFKQKSTFSSVITSEGHYVLSSLRKLAGTLKVLHSLGVALVDIKPENILFCGPNGHDIKLSDLESLVTIEDVPTKMENVRITMTAQYSLISRDLKLLSKIMFGVLSKKDDKRYAGVVSALERLPFVPDFRDKSLLSRLNFLLLSFVDFHALSLVILETMEVFFMLDDFLPFQGTTRYKDDKNIKSITQIKDYFDSVISRNSVTKEAGKKYKDLFLQCYSTLLDGKKVVNQLGTDNPNSYNLLQLISLTVNKWHKLLASPKINPMLLKEVKKLKINKPLLF